MRIYSFFILIFWAGSLFAQKPAIDSASYARWPSLGWPQLSNDGKYVLYTVENGSAGKNTVFLQSTDGKWKKETVNGSRFTADSKFLCYNYGKDSLAMLMPGTDRIKYFPDISSFGLQPTKEGECLYYSPVSQPGTLVLMNLKTHRKKIFKDVLSWKFSEDGTVLLLDKPIKNNPDEQSLNWVDMATQKTTKIVEGKKAETILLDVKHQQLIYKQENTFWYYKAGEKSISLSDRIHAGIEKGFSLNSINNFSKDGKRLFLSLKRTDIPNPVEGAVEVWSYVDNKLPTEQKEIDATPGNYLAVLDLSTNNIIRLQQNLSERIIFPTAINASDTLALVIYMNTLEPWNKNSKVRSHLVSTKTGQKRSLSFLDDNRFVRFSALGKFLLFFNHKDQDYFSYEIATGRIRNLTEGLNLSWKRLYNDDRYRNDYQAVTRGIVDLVWLENDVSVLVYDSYDIWKLDPLSRNKPINLTNGYGRKNGIVFNFIFPEPEKTIINSAKKLYLSAFNTDNKNNGFFQKEIGATGDPVRLSMGPYLYCSNSGYLYGTDFKPIKSENSDTYLVRQMSAIESPNYYSTKDFKIFIKLSDLHPERKYNWYTTELHKWQSSDGRELQGLLYKPENFDPLKKYPVIFNYYERRSDKLNVFLEPFFSEDNINIPTYVSNGYLVFCPDIYYKVSDPMQGADDAVISAANYISRLSFVDSAKLGLQGHSFGGFETNYLITRTRQFAAAVSASGTADLVSAYGGIPGGALSWQFFYENDGEQGRMGASLWESPDAYIKNSPIFQVEKINTPLLLMHTKKDGRCAYANILEFFTGLRRLGKKAWMLVYSEGNHSLNGKEGEDYSIRMMQFFDHYLKDKPAPVWMTRGIEPAKRGLENGYQYDTKIKTPGPGLLNEAEQMKADSLMIRKPFILTLR